MNSYLYATPPLIAAVGSILLGGAVLLKNRRGRLNQVWALFCLCTAVWSFGFFMMYLNNDNYEAALLWNKFYSIGMALIPTVYFHYVLQLIQTKKKWLWFICVANYLLSLEIILLAPTKLFNTGLILQQWGYSPVRGIIGNLFDVTYPVIITGGLLVLLSGLKTSSGRRRVQIKYAIAAATVGFMFGLTNFFPLYGIPVYPLGHIGSLLASIFIAYSIVRHTFMDIEVVLKKGIVYSGATALIVSGYVGIILIGHEILSANQLSGKWSTALMILSVVIIALVFEPIRAGVQAKVDKLFFKTRYDYHEAIKKFSRMVVTILDLDVLLHKTVEIIEQTLMVKEILVFLREPGSGDFVIHVFSGVDESLLAGWRYRSDDELIKHLKARPSRVGEEYGGRINGQVVVSLDIEEKLTGFVVLGDKKSGDVFTPGDFELLNTLADQLSIAVENAWLYRAAITDRLTKVYTGAYFYDRLDEEVARSREHNGRVAVLIFDVDGFAQFGKERGAMVSNRALTMVGEAIKRGNRAYDIAARIGDDEFALILPGADRDNAAFTAGVITKRISDIQIDGESGLLGVKFGMSYTEKGDKSARRLMNDARLELLRNKSVSMSANSRTIKRPS